MNNDLKPINHCREVVKSANKLTGYTGKTLEFKSENVSLTVYLMHVFVHVLKTASSSGSIITEEEKCWRESSNESCPNYSTSVKEDIRRMIKLASPRKKSRLS